MLKMLSMSWDQYIREYIKAREANDVGMLSVLQGDEWQYETAKQVYEESLKRKAKRELAKASGIRAKVGRPAVRDATSRNRGLYLSDAEYGQLQTIGEGSASAGIRKLLALQPCS